MIFGGYARAYNRNLFSDAGAGSDQDRAERQSAGLFPVTANAGFVRALRNGCRHQSGEPLLCLDPGLSDPGGSGRVPDQADRRTRST